MGKTTTNNNNNGLCVKDDAECFPSTPFNTHKNLYSRGVKLIFTGGHLSLVVAFKGPKVILGLYECNYSLTRGKELSDATR